VGPRRSASAGIERRGKTGTAYTATRHGYDHSKYRATFVASFRSGIPRSSSVSVNNRRANVITAAMFPGGLFSDCGGRDATLGVHRHSVDPTQLKAEKAVTLGPMS